MTSATDKTSCISHRRNSRFFVMYEDFLDVAKVSEHQYKLAAFWRVMETKTNDRISYNEKLIEDAMKQGLPEPETNLWLEIPYSDFVKRSLGVYKASSFQVAAAESERLGFTESRTRNRPRNPLESDSPLEEYKEYRFNTDVMQSVLNGGEYPTPIEINRGLLKSIAVRKEKRAIEKNSPPVEINRGRKKTPIKNNSTPLLKSTGNNITEESTTKNGQKEDTLGVSTDVPTPPPAPDLSEIVDDTTESIDNAIEHLTGKSPVEAAMEDSYSLTTHNNTHSSNEERTQHATTHPDQRGHHSQSISAGLPTDVHRGSGPDKSVPPNNHRLTEQSNNGPAQPSAGSQGHYQASDERITHETSAQNPAPLQRGRGAVQPGATGVGAPAQDTPAVVAAAIGNEQARQPKLSQAEFDAAMQKDVKARQQAPHQQNGRNNGRKPTSDTPTKAQLTLQGSEVAKWYAIAASISVRMSGANVRALNTLGEMPGMDEKNLTDVLNLLNASKFVKERGVPIGLQELASEDGAWRFDLWLTTVMRNRQDASRANGKSQTTAETDLQRHNREMREKYAPAGAK